MNARLLLQVHDELILEVPEGEIQPTTKVVQDVMENAYPFPSPFHRSALGQ